MSIIKRVPISAWFRRNFASTRKLGLIVLKIGTGKHSHLGQMRKYPKSTTPLLPKSPLYSDISIKSGYFERTDVYLRRGKTPGSIKIKENAKESDEREGIQFIG